MDNKTSFRKKCGRGKQIIWNLGEQAFMTKRIFLPIFEEKGKEG
ncbi:hypothetical protein [Bacillus massilinigeriensis]